MRRKHKCNPNRVPVSAADVERAKGKAQGEAVEICWAILFTVLRDKENMSNADLRRIWDGVNKLSEEIAEVRVSVSDLKAVLRKEAGLTIG